MYRAKVSRPLRRSRGACVRASLGALALALGTGCAGLPGFESKDPMQAELERLQAEQLRKVEEVQRAELAEQQEHGAPRSYDERLERGDHHLAAGRLGEAVWEYAAAHRLEPDAAAPRVRLGYVHLRHEPERARPLFESALELDPDYASAHTGLGMSMLASDERRAGLRHLERGVELAPDAALAHLQLGVALEQTGDREGGIRHLERARELSPRDGRILNNLGVAYLRDGRPDRAEPLFRQALREDTRDEALRANNLGMALALQGEFEEALEFFLRGGTEQAAHNNLGYAHYVRGEYARAIAEYERALVAGGEASVDVVRNLEAARRARREHGDPRERGPVPQPAVSAGETPEPATPEEPAKSDDDLVAERPAGAAPGASPEPPDEEPYTGDDPWRRPAPPGALDPDA